MSGSLREEFEKIRAGLVVDAVRHDSEGAYARAMLALAPPFIDLMEKESRMQRLPFDVFEGMANCLAQLVAQSLRSTVKRQRRAEFLDRMLTHISAVARPMAQQKTGNIIRPN
jgi:hypothetical protein